MKHSIALGIISTAFFFSCGFSRSSDPIDWNVDIPDDGGTANIGINVSEMTYYSTEFVFKDIAKTMVAVRIGTGFTEGQFDENGYPLSLSAGQSVSLGYGIDTGFAFPEGEYHVFYDGDGTSESAFNTATLDRTIAAGHQAWTVTHGSDEQIGWRITWTNPADHLRNLRIVMPGFENDYATDPIHPSFRAHWSMMKAFRFMDWLRINNSPVVEWERMKPKDYITQVGYSGEWGNQVFDSDPVGSSVELAVDVCNAMDADIWLCIPHRASNDLIQAMASLVLTRLEPERKVYVEFSNEVWNDGFQQAEECRLLGDGLGLAGALEYTVRRSGDAFDIWETVWGAESDRVINVWSWQNVDDWWMLIGLDAFSDPVVNPAGAMPEFYASAPYFTHGDGSPPVSMDELFEKTLFGGEDEEYCLAYLDRMTRRHLEILAPYGVELGCYEAGQHFTSFSGNPALDDRVFIPANRDARMGTCYRKFLADWQNANPGGLMMLYNSCQPPTMWGSWGILERYDQDAASVPKYAAVRDFIEAH